MTDFEVTVRYSEWVFHARTDRGRAWIRSSACSMSRDVYVVPRHMGPMVWRALREEKLDCLFA